MKKEKLLENYEEDFSKQRGSLNEILSHNRKIANGMIEDMSNHNFKMLEEFVEIQKLILDSNKAMTELYKSAPLIVRTTSELTEEEKKQKIDIEALMKSSD